MIEQGLKIFALEKIIKLYAGIILTILALLWLVYVLIINAIEKRNKRKIDKAYKGEDNE